MSAMIGSWLPGDVVRHEPDGNLFVVVQVDKPRGYAIVVQSLSATNPSEWSLVSRALNARDLEEAERALNRALADVGKLRAGS